MKIRKKCQTIQFKRTITGTTFLLLFITKVSFAQTTYQFKTGLLIENCQQYGREAIYTDHLAYQLYTGSLKKPAAGIVLDTAENGQPNQWKEIQADTSGRFKSRALTKGYLYLSYVSDREKTALLNITSNQMVFVNGVARAGDLYGYGFLSLPVLLKNGLNEFYIRGSSFSAGEGIKAKLLFPEKKISINTGDPTLPIVVIGKSNEHVRAAIVIVNSTGKALKNLSLKSVLGGHELTTEIPVIPAMSVRKVGFYLNASSVTEKGKTPCSVRLLFNGTELDKQEIKIESANKGEDYSNTFISEIDGSTQYYSVSPQLEDGQNPPSLYLSVHGAEVQAINQVRAYKSKAEGVLVSPTNRRPRGFNWEDWGRIDAMEVLNIAENLFHPDPKRIYLTGHSMGGHGTWFLGATYAGRWAAIAPCSGYPTLAGYGSADGKIPDTAHSPIEAMLLRASNASNVLELARNYTAAGVYIHHGDSDKVVSVEYARQMHRLLAGFQRDMVYHETPGAGHWYGDNSVDWPPLFEYFKWHTIPVDSIVNHIDFTTANTAVSSKIHWASILQQEQTLKYSRLVLDRDLVKKKISGTTENIAALSFSTNSFKQNGTLSIRLDGQILETSQRNNSDTLYLKKNGNVWEFGSKPDPLAKGTVRNGTFKEPFNQRMVFVYGTKGNNEENNWALNKARFDAESWYYRGNGAVDMVADIDFKAADYPDRGVILYGNSLTNRAYKVLLKNCPVVVDEGLISVGREKYKSNNLAAYFMWPRSDSHNASVAVISGTGIKGMNAATANQYLAGGSGFPDYLIFPPELMKSGAQAIQTAGYYDNSWSIDKNQRVSKN